MDRMRKESALSRLVEIGPKRTIAAALEAYFRVQGPHQRALRQTRCNIEGRQYAVTRFFLDEMRFLEHDKLISSGELSRIANLQRELERPSGAALERYHLAVLTACKLI